MSFDKKWEKSEAITKYVYHSSGWNQDAVIFTAVPFDVYYYEIVALGSEYSEEGIKKGDYCTISVPRDPSIQKISRTDYNLNNGDFTDIDHNVFSHTIGDVCSYPRQAEIRDIIGKTEGKGYRSKDAVRVGQGNGTTELEIKQDYDNTEGNSMDTEVTISSKVGSGGVEVGTSKSFRYGFSYEITNTKSTTFSGTVGDIRNFNDWKSNKYSWGLAAYPHSFGDQKITVINYWVESDICGN